MNILNIGTSFAVRLSIVLIAIYFNSTFIMIIYNPYNYKKLNTTVHIFLLHYTKVLHILLHKNKTVLF